MGLGPIHGVGICHMQMLRGVGGVCRCFSQTLKLKSLIPGQSDTFIN